MTDTNVVEVGPCRRCDGFEPFWVGYQHFDAVWAVDSIAAATRAMNTLEAERFAWIARRHDQVYDEWATADAALTAEVRSAARANRFTDEMDQLVGEVGALIGRGATAARNAIELALALRHRLPLVFEMMFDGFVSVLLARTLVHRADAVTDSAVMHRYDEIVSALLGRKLARGRAVLTENDAKRLADGVLATLDPDAVPPPKLAQRRGIWFDQRRDGLVEVAALLFPEDAGYLDREIDRVAATACSKDPRKPGERRVDALIALVQGYDNLGCQCETNTCDLQAQIPQHATLEAKTTADVAVVINESTLTGKDDEPALIDDRVVPAQQARDLLTRVTEAWFRPLGKLLHGIADTAGENAAGEESTVCGHDMAGYKPSQLQARFLKIRYATCVFPGCAVPFDKCQIDHVTERNHHNPAAGGQTRIGNLVPLCGRHHRIKTEQNWLSDILGDGTVEWHTPTGHSYRTALVQGDDWFPDLDRIAWLDPTRNVKPPAAAADRPTRAEIRNNQRENRRIHYRRLRAKLHEEHPNDPRWTDEPPPY